MLKILWDQLGWHKGNQYESISIDTSDWIASNQSVVRVRSKSVKVCVSHLNKLLSYELLSKRTRVKIYEI